MKAVSLLILLVTSLGFSQDIFIYNVDVFDGERLIDDSTILVEDGKISAVGVENPSNFSGERIDGQGGFIMPGMTNCHVHAFAPTSLEEAAEAGVLNVMDMHGVELYQKMIAAGNEASTKARYFYAGYAATAPEGHGTQYGFPVPTLTSEADAPKFVSDRLAAGASYIKIIREPRAETLSYEIVAAVIKEAQNQGTIAVVHVSNADDAYAVLSAGANALVHIWRDRALSADQFQDLTQNQEFFVIPTLLTTVLVHERLRERGEEGIMTDDELLAEIKRVYDAGIAVLAGTDPPNLDINYGTDLYKELQLLSRAGIPNLEVLKTATSNPADKFGLEGLGYIRQGYTADLVWFATSPLEDMNNLNGVRKVWKSGQEVPQQ